MSRTVLSPEALARALGVRDLTDPAQGRHAMQVLLQELVEALRRAWRCEVVEYRAPPIVGVHENYDALGYPPDGAARDERYTRYVTQDTLLRTQTSALVVQANRKLSLHGREVLLVCPGVVYRRDAVDRLHCAEPHQVDLWRLTDAPCSTEALVELVLRAALPGRRWRVTPATHPYTRHGLQLDVREGADWVEVGECGEANALGLRGLAMGLGLDRLLMLRKGITDIRLLRSTDARAQAQLLDLEPWRPLSDQPATRRDLSLAMSPARADEQLLGDRVREVLGTRADWVEAVTLRSVTPAHALSPLAASRIGLQPHQVNVLVRLTLRALERTLTAAECNALRDEVYEALHEGTTWLRSCVAPAP